MLYEIAWGAVVFVMLIALPARWAARDMAALEAAVGAWTAVIFAYQDYVLDPYQDLVLGLPLPTTLLIFVMVPAMLLINILFVAIFPKSILTEEDLEKFRQLTADSGEDA